MNEYLVFVRGRPEPIRLSSAKYFWGVVKELNDTAIIGFCDESDADVARFPIAEVQAIVNAKYHKRV